MTKQIFHYLKFIAVDFSQRDIRKETNGFSQKSRQIMLPYCLAKADLPQFILIRRLKPTAMINLSRF